MWCAPLLGGAVGAFLLATSIGSGYGVFLLYAPLAAFLTASLLWYALVAKRPEKWKGALVGGLAGCVAHFVCWYLLLAHARILHLITGGYLSSLGEPPMTMLQAFMGAGVYALWSLFIMGWATIGAGAAIGFFVARRQDREA